MSTTGLDGDRGHRTRDEAGRRVVSAWGPTLETCLAETILGTSSPADDPSGAVSTPIGVHAAPGPLAEMASEIVEEAVNLQSVFGMAAVDAAVVATEDGGLECAIDVADASLAERRPAVLANLELHSTTADPVTWQCEVELGFEELETS